MGNNHLKYQVTNGISAQEGHIHMAVTSQVDGMEWEQSCQETAEQKTLPGPMEEC